MTATFSAPHAVSVEWFRWVQRGSSRPRSNSAPSDHGRREGLDGLRGIAALAVVLFHYTSHYCAEHGPHTTELAFAVPFGFLGVDLFFVLSGFVILLSTERSSGVAAFAKGRFLRLWPLFLLCCSVTVLFAWTALGSAPTAGQFLSNVSMIPLFFGQSPIDGSYWTLGCEVTFYALAALALVYLRIRAEIFCLMWLAVGAVCVWGVPQLIPGKLLFVIQPKFAPLFVLGMMTSRLDRRNFGPLSLVVTVAALLSIALQGPHWGKMLLVSGMAYALLVCGAMGLVYGSANSMSGPWNWRALRWVGRVSYPFYLLHQSIGYVIINKLESLGVDANSSILIAIGVTLFASEVALRLVGTSIVTHPIVAARKLRTACVEHSETVGAGWVVIVDGCVSVVSIGYAGIARLTATIADQAIAGRIAVARSGGVFLTAIAPTQPRRDLATG